MEHSWYSGLWDEIPPAWGVLLWHRPWRQHSKLVRFNKSEHSVSTISTNESAPLCRGNLAEVLKLQSQWLSVTTHYLVGHWRLAGTELSLSLTLEQIFHDWTYIKWSQHQQYQERFYARGLVVLQDVKLWERQWGRQDVSVNHISNECRLGTTGDY